MKRIEKKENVSNNKMNFPYLLSENLSFRTSREEKLLKKSEKNKLKRNEKNENVSNKMNFPFHCLLNSLPMISQFPSHGSPNSLPMLIKFPPHAHQIPFSLLTNLPYLNHLNTTLVQKPHLLHGNTDSQHQAHSASSSQSATEVMEDRTELLNGLKCEELFSLNTEGDSSTAREQSCNTKAHPTLLQ